jgi:glycosyltransferase involved in cell wall biosynthesis
MSSLDDNGPVLPREMNVEQAERRLRVAVLYSRNPFPMWRGDQLTVAHLISYLAARGHQVDLFTLANGGHSTPDQDRWLRSACRRVEIIKHGFLDILYGVLYSLFTGLPFQIGYFRNLRFNATVAKALQSGQYDVVYVYYLRSAQAVTGYFASNKTAVLNGRRTAAFLAMQLSQSLNTRRIVQAQRWGLKKLFYYWEWRRMQRYEARTWSQFTRTMLIGTKDVEAVQEVCREQNLPVIDNWRFGAHGTDTDSFRPARVDETVPYRLIFSGAMAYRPNTQAALWFINHCWPAIRAHYPQATLFLVGRHPPQELTRFHGMDNITVTGAVPDIGEYIRTAHICINPVHAAGGMQNKLIEYFSSAKPVVSTSTANEGIAAPPTAFALADSPTEFTNAVIRLFGDPQAARQMAENARQFVVDEWTWESHFNSLEEEFLKALHRHSQPAVQVPEPAHGE